MENKSVATSSAPAVVVEKKPEVQLDMLGFLTGNIGAVLQSKNLTNKDGEVVGNAITTMKLKDIAKAQNLEGKANRDALQDFIDKTGNAALRTLLVDLGLQGDKFKLVRGRSSKGKDGLLNVSFGLKEIKRKTGPSDEEIAKALGWTVEQVRETRVRQEATLAGQEIEVESTTAESK